MPAEGERVLFDGRSRAGFAIVVTTRYCRVNGIKYPIVELDALGASRGDLPISRGRGTAALVAVCGTLTLATAAICLGWTRQLWGAVAVTAVVMAALTMLPLVTVAALRRPYQIWARHRGTTVLMFLTEDPEQHGQVARALGRAREFLHEQP